MSSNDLSEYEGNSSDRDGEAFKEYFVEQALVGLGLQRQEAQGKPIEFVGARLEASQNFVVF